MELGEQEIFDNSSENLEFDGVSEGGWIQWFCALEGNDFFVEIEEEYIRDSFNLYGLKGKFEAERYRWVSGFYYLARECLELILSPYSPTEQDLQDENFLELNQEASDLYGLVHSRFTQTPRGNSNIKSYNIL